MKMMNKVCALVLSVALCAGMAAPAFAYGGEPVEEVEQPVLTSTIDEEDVVTVTDEESGALTPEGNLTLVDDYHTSYSDGSGQQFITLVSKSGNTFYLVIDRNDKGENTVHFMNLVDEADLLALMEEDAADAYTAEKEATAQAEQERKQAEEDAKKAEEEAAASGSEQTGGNKVTKYAATFLGVLALVGLVAGGGIYTFMKQKQKKQAEKEALDPDADYSEDKGDFEIPVEENRKKPVRRITQKNNFTGGVCRLTYLNLKRTGVDAYCLISLWSARNPQSGQLTQRFSVRPIDRMVIGRATVISSAGAWGTWWNWLRPMCMMPSTSSGALQTCPSCRKSGSIWCLRPPKSSLASCKS